MGSFLAIVRQITVEPIIFLVFLGLTFGHTIQAPGLYEKVCMMYHGNEIGVNCSDLAGTPKVEHSVQKDSSLWTLLVAVSYLAPAVLADVLLGAYGDKHGRKINILLGITGVVVSEYGYSLALSRRVNAPMYSLLIFGVVTGATGYVALIPVSCQAYLADITPDKNQLTIRSGIVNVAQGLASVFGGILAVVLSKIRIPVAIDLELIFYIMAIIYTILRIKQRPDAEEMKLRLLEGSGDKVAENSRGLLAESWHLLKQGLQVYRKPRVGHRRLFMIATVFAMMLVYTTALETRSYILSTYTLRCAGTNALCWKAKDLGLWNAVGYLMLIIGTLVGLFVTKRMLHWRETTLIIVGLLSSSARSVTIGLARNKWQMYLANLLGAFAGVANAAIISFMAQLAAAEEVGRAFSLFGIAVDLAFILTNIVYNNIYSATVEWYPGFLFCFIAAIQSLLTVVMVWVHFQSVKEGVGTENSEQETKDHDNTHSSAVIKL